MARGVGKELLEVVDKEGHRNPNRLASPAVRNPLRRGSGRGRVGDVMSDCAGGMIRTSYWIAQRWPRDPGGEEGEAAKRKPEAEAAK